MNQAISQQSQQYSLTGAQKATINQDEITEAQSAWEYNCFSCSHLSVTTSGVAQQQTEWD